MHDSSTVTTTFCGTSTIHLSDGRSSLLIDGFFSRPSLERVAFSKIKPDEARIREALHRAHIDSVDAVLVAHSHVDHAMDAPTVVRMVGGTLFGSESTLNIGRPRANFVPGAFNDITADVVYLGVGALGAQDRSFQEEYWAHVVGATSARLVVPIHWDNFFVGLDRPLRAMPPFLDSAARTRAVVETKASELGIPARWPEAFKPMNPFA